MTRSACQPLIRISFRHAADHLEYMAMVVLRSCVQGAVVCLYICVWFQYGLMHLLAVPDLVFSEMSFLSKKVLSPRKPEEHRGNGPSTTHDTPNQARSKELAMQQAFGRCLTPSPDPGTSISTTKSRSHRSKKVPREENSVVPNRNSVRGRSSQQYIECSDAVENDVHNTGGPQDRSDLLSVDRGSPVTLIDPVATSRRPFGNGRTVLRHHDDLSVIPRISRSPSAPNSDALVRGDKVQPNALTCRQEPGPGRHSEFHNVCRDIVGVLKRTRPPVCDTGLCDRASRLNNANLDDHYLSQRAANAEWATEPGSDLHDVQFEYGTTAEQYCMPWEVYNDEYGDPDVLDMSQVESLSQNFDPQISSAPPGAYNGYNDASTGHDDMTEFMDVRTSGDELKDFWRTDAFF